MAEKIVGETTLGGQTWQQEEAAPVLRPGDCIAPERLYLNRKGEVVPNGPDKAELFAAKGTVIRREDAERVGYKPPQVAAPAPAEAETAAEPEVPAPKPPDAPAKPASPPAEAPKTHPREDVPPRRGR